LKNEKSSKLSKSLETNQIKISPRSQTELTSKSERNDKILGRVSSIGRIVVKRGNLFKLNEKGIKSWQQMYFELDSFLLSYFRNAGDQHRLGAILLENIIEMKVVENDMKGIYAIQIMTTTQNHFMYSKSKEDTHDWLNMISPLHRAARARSNQLTQRTEPDGSIVLNVIVPSIQESKRIKFDSKMSLEDVKNSIREKFMKTLEKKGENTELYDIWILRSGKWIGDKQKDTKPSMIFYFKTQDVIEFKMKTNTVTEPILMGYLLKRDPSGLVKGWKKRFFQLKALRLYYSLSEKDIDKPIAFIDLKKTFAVSTLPQINEKSFSVWTAERTYFLQASTKEEMSMWISGMEQVQKFKKQIFQENSWIREIEITEKEGFLTKQGNRVKTWNRRWFVMRDGFLYYYKSKNGVQETKGTIPLYSCKIEISHEIPTQQLGFQIITTSRAFHVYADSDRETQDWMDAILKHKSQIESKVDSIYFEM